MSVKVRAEDSITAELNAAKDPWAEQMREHLESITLELPVNDPETMTIKIEVPESYTIIECKPDFRIKLRRENLDPEGIFLESIEPKTNRIRVAWFKHLGEKVQLSEVYYGYGSVSIYDTMITNHPKMQPSSAAALARDLAIAEVAISKGLGYLPANLSDLL